MAKRQPASDEFKFEQAMKRLEEIVEKIEQGGSSLDAMMGLYEEGARLSKQCLEHLQATELKLKKLTKDIDGSFELTEE